MSLTPAARLANLKVRWGHLWLITRVQGERFEAVSRNGGRRIEGSLTDLECGIYAAESRRSAIRSNWSAGNGPARKAGPN